MKWISCLVWLGVALLISACGGEGVKAPSNAVTSAPNLTRTMTKRGFVRLADDPRIAYESGAKAMALEVKRHLDKKAAIIEQRQYAAFSKPIYVYLLNSENSAKRYCIVRLARGCVVNQTLYVTSRAKDTLPSLLQHELSHLHFEQKLGMLRYHSEVPAWFQEGLAVFVSDGAGAERTSFADAIKGLRSDQSITPNETRSLLFPKKAKQFGMRNSMFYAQSGLFVNYLYQQNPKHFKRLVLEVAAGQGFARTFERSYGVSLKRIWLTFKAEVMSNDLESLQRYRL
ncbi:MAG: hypothetical protein ACPG47_10195 [Leucothrix sp.]